MAAKNNIVVFLDLEIGDQQAAREQEQGYASAKNFLEATQSVYGWPPALSQLETDESKELFLEAFSSDPSWSSKGTARIDPPNALVKGRLEIQLDTAAAPKACENFRCLATGERGKGKSSGKLLHYKGCKLHRCVKGFVAQGGDFVKGDGSGGDSIYSGAFKDEKGGLAAKHDAAGVVGMANSGAHTNKSQFYVTLAAAPQCDGKHVVLGRVRNEEGLGLLARINEFAATEDGTPATEVLIADCGQL
jgi:peptidylprolyl isomerase